MITFDEAYQIANESSSEAAFNRDECFVLFLLAKTLPADSVVVEIGVQFGRSLSILAAVSREKDQRVMGIDSWQEEVSAEAKAHVESQIKKYDWRVKLINAESHEAWGDLAYSKREAFISLLHIDGDHEYQGVLRDCIDWCPMVEVGGYVCFDDYGHDSLPGVYQAVTEYMRAFSKQWEFIGRYGNKLGVFKKVA